MKKLLIIVLGRSVFTIGMQPETYLDVLPQELQKELIQFTTSLQDIRTFEELQEKLNEIQQKAVHLKRLSSLVQALNNLQQQLKYIKNANYTNALAALQTLSKDKELEFLFNNPDFNRILISELYNSSAPENILKDLNTPGALKWLKQLEFIDAAGKGSVKAVKEFLDAGINSNAKNKDGYTALIYATSNGYKDIVKLLLAKADINANNYGTALHRAAVARHKDIVEMLLNKGANVNAQDGFGNTALIISCVGT